MKGEGGDEVFVEGGIGKDGQDVFKKNARGREVGKLDRSLRVSLTVS